MKRKERLRNCMYYVNPCSDEMYYINNLTFQLLEVMHDSNYSDAFREVKVLIKDYTNFIKGGDV